jgi:NADH-quinone oxidoreductase subunit L
VPPLSGFYSKDAILAAAESRPLLFGLGVLVAGLTAFYMFRLVFVALRGVPRDSIMPGTRSRIAGPTMLWPLILVRRGLDSAGFDRFRECSVGLRHDAHGLDRPRTLRARAVAAMVSPRGSDSPSYPVRDAAQKDPLPEKLGARCPRMRDKFYFDEFYAVGSPRPYCRLGSLAVAGLRAHPWESLGACCDSCRRATCRPTLFALK